MRQKDLYRLKGTILRDYPKWRANKNEHEEGYMC